MSIQPCTCDQYNPYCGRANGRGMSHIQWMLCSGQCGGSLRCTLKDSLRARAIWDVAAGRITKQEADECLASGVDTPKQMQDQLGDYPSYLEQVKNLAKAATKHILGGMKKVPLEVHDQRMALCNACEHMDKDQSRCRKCGCALQSNLLGEMAKPWLATEACPVGKWQAYNGDSTSGEASPTGK